MDVLSAIEARVLGALIEKQLTTPQYYPLTLNALVAACNQSSNRDPVTAYGHEDVQRTLDDLKARGLARLVHPSHGERSTKYRQVLDETLALEPDERAVLAVLLLRGPQTSGELRIRTERLHPFSSLGEVEACLGRLAARDHPLVVHQPRLPGQKEARWADLLTDAATAPPPDAGAAGTVAPSSPGSAPGDADRVAALERAVRELRRDVDELRDLLR